MEENTPEKRKRGRPPIYNDSFCDELVELMEQGYLDVEIYSKWGITKETFYEWKRSHPEFKEAHDIGMPKCEAALIKKFRQMADGTLEGKHSFNALISLANNKFGWRRDSEGKGDTININNVNVLSTKSDQELLDIVQQKLAILKIPQLEQSRLNDVIDVETESTDDDEESN